MYHISEPNMESNFGTVHTPISCGCFQTFILCILEITESNVAVSKFSEIYTAQENVIGRIIKTSMPPRLI